MFVRFEFLLTKYYVKTRPNTDKYYLEARRDLLEIAALLDRYDAAVERGRSLPQKDKKHAVLYKSFVVSRSFKFLNR